MGTLEQIKIIANSIGNLIRLRKDLIEEALEEENLTWKELAFADRFSAVGLCLRQEDCGGIEDARKMVDDFLGKYKTKHVKENN